MAELPDIRPGGWPDPPPPATSGAVDPLGPIGGQAPRFGVAHELDLIQRGSLSPTAGNRSARAAAARRRAAAALPADPSTWERLRIWWSDCDLTPADLRHRMLCRRGRHDFQGGRQIQLGGRFVNTERCCAWCQAKPE